MFVNERPVCGDIYSNWDFTDAGVVCGSLFQNGIALEAIMDIESRFGEVALSFSMDKVQCRGNETSLLQCEHQIIKNEDSGCIRNYAAGVVCTGNQTIVY